MHELPYKVWPKLVSNSQEVKATNLEEMFTANPGRASRYSIETGGIYLDYSKNLINDDSLKFLTVLAEEASVLAKAKQMYNGAIVNNTESRAALHTLLRCGDKDVPESLSNEHAQVLAVLKTMTDISQSIRSGRWTGASGKPITDIVHLGIGGSYLGPNLVDEALASQRDKTHDIKVHYIANVDAHHLYSVLEHLDPIQTLVVIVSKTFSTLETLTNARSSRHWLLEEVPEQNISKHLIAISSNREAAASFGVAEENILPIWDWVGGRYSLWSAVSLSIMIRYGSEIFHQLLQGAAAMDKHFVTSPEQSNMPLMMALISTWYQHLFGAESHAVLPYDHRLRLLPEHLQQLDMESNGKQTNLNGEPVEYATGAIVWGGEGTNGQHAFHQLLHQGTRFCGIDFILTLQPDHDHEIHHDKLVASCLSQSMALMLGRSFEELGSVKDPLQRKHKVMPGNRPSNTLLLTKLDAATIGALIALYEHKVFCQAAIWQTNPFDQWGVELGKELGDRIYEIIHNNTDTQMLDTSSQELLARYLSKTNRINKRGQ